MEANLVVLLVPSKFNYYKSRKSSLSPTLSSATITFSLTFIVSDRTSTIYQDSTCSTSVTEVAPSARGEEEVFG